MIRLFRKIRNQLLSEDKYSMYILYAVGEILLVMVGILLALQIDNWNENRKTAKEANIYTEKLINDLVIDTLNINRLITDASMMQKNIEDYFEYFNSGDIPLQNLLDSSKNVYVHFFRYFPINYTLIDMQSSGKIELLNEEQRLSLIELTNAQDFLIIIIEKTIEDIKKQQTEMSKYFDSDLSESDFFEKVSWNLDNNHKLQGLLHKHNELTQFHRLTNYMGSHGTRIKNHITHSLTLLQ